MTVEEVKARLRRYNDLRHECRRLARRIQSKRRDMEGLRAVKTDALPGGRGNSLESAVERIDALERRYRDKLLIRDAAQLSAEALIALAEDETGRDILELHYIDGVRFEDIPEKLFISSATMWRRYNQAIQEIAKK